MRAARGKYTRNEIVIGYKVFDISIYVEIAQYRLTFRAAGNWTAGKSHIWRPSPRMSPAPWRQKKVSAVRLQLQRVDILKINRAENTIVRT